MREKAKSSGWKKNILTAAKILGACSVMFTIAFLVAYNLHPITKDQVSRLKETARISEENAELRARVLDLQKENNVLNMELESRKSARGAQVQRIVGGMIIPEDSTKYAAPPKPVEIKPAETKPQEKIKPPEIPSNQETTKPASKPQKSPVAEPEEDSAISLETIEVESSVLESDVE
jgi:outer membrane biosynthesis protein TonB